MYVITKVGSALKVVETGADTIVFTSPTLTLRASAAYPSIPAACVEIKQGEKSVQVTTANLTSINGATGTAIDTLAEIFDALSAVPSGNLAVTTNVSGATYTAFTSTACSQLTIFNSSGTAIDVRQGAAGTAVSLASGTAFTFVGITNASQLDVRRTDVSNTPVTVGARYQA